MKHTMLLITTIWSFLLEFIQGYSFDMKSLLVIPRTNNSTIIEYYNDQMAHTNLTLDTINNTMTVEICIGEPKQCFNLLYDTGNKYSILADGNKPNVLFNKSYYNNQSSTFKDLTNYHYKIHYKSSRLELVDIRDNVTLTHNESFSYDFLLASSGSIPYYFDGVLGLGARITNRFSFVSALYAQNLITHRMFGHEYMNYTHGKLYIGEMPKSFIGKHYQKCFIDDSDEIYHTNWNCNLTSILVYDKENITEMKSKVLFDTAATYILAPYDEGRQVFELLINISNHQCETEDRKISDILYQTLICKKGVNKLKFPDMTFNISGMMITYTKINMFGWIKRNGVIRLMSTIVISYKTPDWVLGEPALKNYDMIFDYDNKCIGTIPNENDAVKWYVPVIGISIILFSILFIRVVCLNKTRLCGGKKKTTQEPELGEQLTDIPKQ